MSASAAKEIRAALKSELGLTSKHVSVRSRPCTYSTAVDVRIKSESVSRRKVEDVARRFRNISRCEISNEILGGGNTFVSVEHEWTLVHARTDEVRALLAQLISGDADEVEVFGFRAWVSGQVLRVQEIDGDRGNNLYRAHESHLGCAARWIAVESLG